MNHQSTPIIDFSKLPSRKLIYKFIDELVDFIFPVESAITAHSSLKVKRKDSLIVHLQDILHPLEEQLPQPPETIVERFFNSVDSVHYSLTADAIFFMRSDPAVENIEEVIIAYPGFYAITVYRLSHELVKLGVPIVPRVISEYAHNKTGIDIHPGATIGNPSFIDHGTGVVIGQTAVIGKRVKMYQGVTLGALAVKKDGQGTKRHPTIEDDVIIYAGSCILGGATTIGRESIIGGNVWLTASVPPLSVVYHKSDIRIRDKSEMNEIIDFII